MRPPKELLVLVVEEMERQLISAPPGAKLTTENLNRAVQAVIQTEAVDVPKWTSGAKLTKRDAAERIELMRRFYKFSRLINSESSAALAALRKEISEKSEPKVVYLPRETSARDLMP
jgi:hypothetical protein